MSSKDRILVTGGAGFIGSHFARLAHDAGSRVVVLDDLGSRTQRWPDLPAKIVRVVGDIADRALVSSLWAEHQFTSVVHFAGKICVSESVAEPARYYDQNVVRAIALINMLTDWDVPFLFSSSAAVYGAPPRMIIGEDCPCEPTSPYGATKLAIEQVLAAYGKAYGLPWMALRYFNAAGAHPDGSLRESHKPETHLIPLAIDAALSSRPLEVFGDGTQIRDYVHVCDLAKAHLDALDVMDVGEWGPVNLGAGCGTSVRDVIEVVSRIVGKSVPRIFAQVRPGDPDRLVADTKRAQALLGWKPERSDLPTIVDDAIRSRRA